MIEGRGWVTDILSDLESWSRLYSATNKKLEYDMPRVKRINNVNSSLLYRPSC